MQHSDQSTVTLKTGTILAVALIVCIAAADILYLIPRYGGIFPYLFEANAAGSMLGQTEGRRDAIAAALEIYYNDSDMKYPPSLEALWNRQYMTGPMPGENVFIEVSGGKFKRAHWRRDSAKVKIFRSRAEADDSGGWGYVADPDSPEWGTVFVNCTHDHFKKRVPWNLSTASAVRPGPQDQDPYGQQNPGGLAASGQ